VFYEKCDMTTMKLFQTYSDYNKYTVISEQIRWYFTKVHLLPTHV